LATASEPIAVPVAEACCPDCGGQLGAAQQEIVSTTDIPAQPQPEIHRYEVEVRRCRQCGSKVRGRHPGIAVGQHGATAYRIGPRVKALAHILHYVHGVPVRKTPAIIEDLTGVRLTQSAITQDAIRQSEGAVGARYEALRASVREQAVVHTDDTGWRVGGRTAFLMAFVNVSLSVYQVRWRHRNEEVWELIPADFGGVLVCDRGRSYDAVELRRSSATEMSGAPDPQCGNHSGGKDRTRPPFRDATGRYTAACPLAGQWQERNEAGRLLEAGRDSG
jgi:transposase